MINLAKLRRKMSVVQPAPPRLAAVVPNCRSDHFSKMVMMKVLLVAALPLLGLGQNTDLFNYYGTDEDARDFGPRDWENVECDDVEDCLGYPEKWQIGEDYGWGLGTNWCRNCEEQDSCGDHHQSPIDLKREWGYDKQLGDEGYYNCGDNHWMQYESGTCDWEHFKAANAATVERHALRISQPLEKFEGTWRVNCLKQGRGRLFSRLDMSGGYSQWWRLNHIEIHTPSEHLQEGKRYDAEVQMGHFYSAPQGIDNGSFNQMATIAVFLQASDDVEPYPYLDKAICLWRYHEDQKRFNCSLPSVESHYPGCFPYTRGHSGVTAPVRANNETRKTRRLMVIDNDATNEELAEGLWLDPAEWRPAEMTEEEWAAEQEEYSKRHPAGSPTQWSNGTTTRHLMDYEHVPHFNYQFLKDCRTEYYFRYEGTTTYPPCYGRHGGTDRGNRDRTNTWRFMKDPIRIHTRQLKEMHRLLRERIAPADAPRNACELDTAARIEPDGTAWTARPLQELDEVHDHWFCECEDWGSKVPEDKLWCRSGDRDKEYRWWERPYGWGGESFDAERRRKKE